jgi:hypothetical protein
MPSKATVIHPRRFSSAANNPVRIFLRQAAVRLASIKRGGLHRERIGEQ